MRRYRHKTGTQTHQAQASQFRNAVAEATTNIDNLTVRITGNGGEAVPNVESAINFTLFSN